MSDFKHILVPFDSTASSRGALRVALNMSKVFQSKITAVYVNIGRGANKTEEVKSAIAEIQKSSNVEISLLQPTGKMYKEVVRAAEDVQADIIIMGNHGSSTRDMFFIGSNAYRVVSSSHIPVITLQEGVEGGFQNIVVPIDQSKETRQKIPVVALLAKNFNAKVHLFGASKYDDDESRLKVKQYMGQSIEMLKEYDMVPSRSTLFGKNIAKSTLDEAKKIGADLIVMMAESEPSSGLFMGTNAQQVVNRSSIPVLTLHAKDVGITYAGY